ncbi:MAG: peptidoglycan-binding protein, partial [Oscillospiraceae bacterium]|nr:peptidoglycan-binding protein [Oscillospiraceae bacterium]
FCNGTTVTCQGLSQWGSQDLAEQGLNSVQILRYYYGDNIELATTNRIRNVATQYPGYPFRRGDTGEYVVIIQRKLNRISQNYPAIPKVYPVDGIFGENTENAVRIFQSIFNLVSDGIVGEATWNKLAYLYVAITRLSELESEGVTVYRVSLNYAGANYREQSSDNTKSLQYMLAVISEFNDFIPSVNLTGIYDEQTKEAVMAFQREYGLPVTGTLGTATWDLIYRVYISIYSIILSSKEYFPVSTEPFDGKEQTLRSAGESVINLQEYINCIFLEKYGIKPIGITGIFGRQTQQAVRRYQADNGLPVTGIVNDATYQSIENSYKDVVYSTTSRRMQYPGFVLQEGDTDDNIRGNNYV